jgi:hypothetical protein
MRVAVDGLRDPQHGTYLDTQLPDDFFGIAPMTD